MALAFGDHVLDIGRRELCRAGAPIALAPQVFDLLVYLLQHRERVLTKDDLIEGVWGGRIVSDSALTTRINAARKAIGDNGEDQRLIRTFARKGFRFVGEVREEGEPALPAAVSPTAAEITAGPTPPLPDKPSIAVLPFANMSGDPEQEYFADGMVEEIITALSRIRWLFVIARNSSFTYKSQAIDVKQVGRELGVRYVLEGSVRKAGSRVRITAQLIDSQNGAHLWADRFEGSLEDVFDLQDKVASSVAGVIEPALQAAETVRSANRPTNDLTAYDLYLRASAVTFRFSKEDLIEAARLLEEAIARDPRYGPALAFASMAQMRLAMDGWAEDLEASRQKAMTFARRALDVGGNDPIVLVNAAHTLAYLGEEVTAMAALVDRALALNPSYARGWYVSGLVRMFSGQPDLAIEHVEKSMRLSPRDYPGIPAGLIGTAHFLARRFPQAIECLLQSMQEGAMTPWRYRLLAASYAYLGRLDDAREVTRQLRATGACVMPSRMMLPNRILHQLLLDGLCLAAGEAT
jgi:TolB-like protein